MGEDHTTGLVNDGGQVFDAAGNLHEGLYVADGSIIPTALNVNPFLTISALAERIAEGLVSKLGGIPAVISSI
jgi:cholesterol oxidase